MKNIRLFLGLTLNYIIDYFIFMKESGIFRKNVEEKLLAYITFTYHTIEKGFSMPQIRYGFGKKKVGTLLNNVLLYLARNYNTSRSQFIAACSVLEQYYCIHLENNFNISDYFTEKQYDSISRYAKSNIGGALKLNNKEYFSINLSNFEEFIKTRRSVRYFSENKVDIEKLEKAVELANFCPSACNRQSSKVYLINIQEKVDKILNIQKGVLATADQIHQLLVITSNRNYFFTSGERNQMFVDGGIFLESLLLCLHNEKIASCTLHWSLNFTHDKKIADIVGLTKGEKVIALVAVGNLVEDSDYIKVPYSHRKSVNELLVVR
jgi:nitroreductase